MAYMQIIILDSLYFQGSLSGIKDYVYSCRLEVRESHLSGDLRYQDILMNLFSWIDVSFTKEPFLKEGKTLRVVLHLVDQRCMCSSQIMTTSARALREVNSFKWQYQYRGSTTWATLNML